MFNEALNICKKLISFPSITPEDSGSFDFLKSLLESRGFNVQIFSTEDTKNFYAHWCRPHNFQEENNNLNHFSFVGHIDVVPPGDLDSWNNDPFRPVIDHHHLYGESLYGRGTADMKGAIACFLSAVFSFQDNETLQGRISIILTSDEEGFGTYGIRTLVPFLKEQNIHGFLVGEPTGSVLGENLQIGRRGSLIGYLKAVGIQGHIACPEFFKNPILDMARCVVALQELHLDNGNDLFPPSHLEVTTIDTGNTTQNIVPAQCTARFGVRFNTIHNEESLKDMIYCCVKKISPNIDVSFRLSGLPYGSPPSHFTHCVLEAMKNITGKNPTLTTKGGITDGRWLAPLGPVVELGFPEDTIHQTNECIALKDIEILCKIYFQVLLSFFQENDSF